MMLFCSDGGTTHEEYLTIQQVAERLNVKPKTIRNKMSSGIFKRGTHYVSPRGLGPRFKWSAVKAWLESDQENNHASQEDNEDGIPMARGYTVH
jgi:excisionase family DNA binding protein